MKRPIRRLSAVFLATLLLVGLAGCGRKNAAASQSDDSLQKILDAGQLVLGLDMAFPPMGFVDESGEVVGFDIDVAREVCDRLGVELVLQRIDWDEKENDLNEGRIDCIWNGLSVTPARKETMCLSKAYMKNELIFVVPGNSSLINMSDLSGVTVGVQSGATAQEAIEASDYDVSVALYDTVQELLDGLKSGELDAALVDSVVAYYFIFSSEDTFFILPDSISEEEYAIAFRKNDLLLCEKVQELVADMKADGSLGEISKKWFGSDITIVR